MPPNECQRGGTGLPQGDSGPSDLIPTEGLTKEFKGFRAVNGVTLDVKRGTIHALIGPNFPRSRLCAYRIAKQHAAE
jgi:branched-chain amino acid transport system ATP-binding protein